MKTIDIQNYTIVAICYLHILLFVYAAASKLLDFQNFQAQLGQSPLLSAYTSAVSVGVIVSEFAIAILLAIPKFRHLGLLLSFGLMISFTAYIVIVLNFSDYIPCSCGGVLEKMTWTQHLIFNIIFILLSVLGTILLSKSPKREIS